MATVHYLRVMWKVMCLIMTVLLLPALLSALKMARQLLQVLMVLTFLQVSRRRCSISCGKAGYNITTDIVTVVELDIVTHDFTLTQPNMIVNPLYIEETLNPGEYFTTSLNVLNNGNGPLGWAAEIIYPETDQALAGTTIEGLPASMYKPTDDNTIGGGNGQALGEDGNRDLMLCPEGSIFSIPPVSSNNGYTSTAGLPYFVYQSFSGVEGAISTGHFLGDFIRVHPPASPTFLD